MLLGLPILPILPIFAAEMTLMACNAESSAEVEQVGDVTIEAAEKVATDPHATIWPSCGGRKVALPVCTTAIGEPDPAYCKAARKKRPGNGPSVGKRQLPAPSPAPA